MNCVRCLRPGRRRGETAEQYPGTVELQARRLCSGCTKWAIRNGCLEKFPKGDWPAKDNWTVQDCVGGCGKRVRRSRLKLADYPDTVGDKGGRRCGDCREEQFHNGRGAADAAQDVARNKASLDAWLTQMVHLASKANNRRLTRGLPTCRI